MAEDRTNAPSAEELKQRFEKIGEESNLGAGENEPDPATAETPPPTSRPETRRGSRPEARRRNGLRPLAGIPRPGVEVWVQPDGYLKFPLIFRRATVVYQVLGVLHCTAASTQCLSRQHHL